MPSSKSPSGPLACPRCARSYPLSERFCADCRMPLVYSGTRDENPVTETHERARKIKPQYARGSATKVAFAHNQSEAELIQGLLLEEGVPSYVRRSPGFDVPDFLAAGPREILVPEAGAEVARELLQGTQVLGAQEGEELTEGQAKAASVFGPLPAAKLFAWILLVAIAGFLIVWGLDALAG